MNERDLTRLGHMLDYARAAFAFTKDQTRETLEDDHKLSGAILWSITVVGEAANHVSREVQDANPQIPWPQIIGMRNRLVHGYAEVQYDLLWQTLIIAVPALIMELEKLLASENE